MIERIRKLSMDDILNIAILILLVSALIDGYLWIETQYMVPCWVLSLLFIGISGLLIAIKMIVNWLVNRLLDGVQEGLHEALIDWKRELEGKGR